MELPASGKAAAKRCCRGGTCSDFIILTILWASLGGTHSARASVKDISAGIMPDLDHALGTSHWVPKECSLGKSKSYVIADGAKNGKSPRPLGWRKNTLENGKQLMDAWAAAFSPESGTICPYMTRDCCVKKKMRFVRLHPKGGEPSFPGIPPLQNDERNCTGLADVKYAEWGSCAFVSRGSSILRAEHGTDIDAHDTVIRLGHMPLLQWKAFTGSRTDVLIGRGTIQARHAGEYPNIRYVIGNDSKKKNGAQTPIKLWGATSAKPTPVAFGKAKVFLGDSRVSDSLYKSMTAPIGKKNRGPSTGIDAVLRVISSGLCRNIDIYGMSANCGGHYYDLKDRMKTHHSCELESW
eukprot:CAMPEP_0197581258 /NCGR_PEP_ID=MMETSP1326-20131121/4834_1 /TAXON_ID=1155430 /ORGANISM="Genus nov. species nov., Strain RCC2288" /LENGTH=351 /DNA_ID=CAMNT_0043145141 /DNA_START=149 /DNA_END=1201 /DNA_ORIENTATION=+